MSVVLSSWGCESGRHTTGDCLTTPGATFQVPITFTIYEDDAGTAPGDVLGDDRRQIVNVQYRPSASANCSGGAWYNAKDHTCYNGFVQTIKMTMSGVATVDRSKVIWSVAYNTTNSGHTPIGVTGSNTRDRRMRIRLLERRSLERSERALCGNRHRCGCRVPE